MTRFRYRAADSAGRVVRGELDARAPEEARAMVDGLGLVPLRVWEAVPRLMARRQVSSAESVMLLRCVASLLDAGVPVRAALCAATDLASTGAGKAAVETIRHAVDEGHPLSHGCAEARMIANAHLEVLRAGERSGSVGAAVSAVAELAENEKAAAERLRRALAYPTILVVTGIASAVVVGVVVVPKFAAILAGSDRALPHATQIVVDGATVMRKYGAAVGLAAGALGTVLWSYYHRPGKLAGLHRVLLALPFVGPLRLAWATATAASALSAALSNGTPILASLDIAGEASGDAEVRGRLANARRRVAGGSSLAAALRAEASLAPAAITLIGLGEASGRLADMAMRASRLARSEAEHTMAQATTMIEPAFVLALGAVIAFVAGAMFQAVYAIGPVR